MIDWSALSLSPSKQALNQHCHHWPWSGHAPQLPSTTMISFPTSLLCLTLFQNCVILQDLLSQPRWSQSQNQRLLSSWCNSRQTLLPLGSIPWNQPGFIPPELMHLWDLLSPWFSTLDKFSLIAGGVPTPATIFPSLWEDHVNNHISL